MERASHRTQEQGWIGRMVGNMIRRSVRMRFRNVYWDPPTNLRTPTIFVANHHGWHDGYLMFHLVTKLQVPTLDWIQEYASFPLFGKIGGMPFPADDASVRAATIKRTVQRMRAEQSSLCLFAEGTLHRPPEVWELGRALDLVRRQVSGVSVTPVGIVYDMSLHERPEAFIRVGASLANDSDAEVREVLVDLLTELRRDIVDRPESFEVLARGTLDVNERWDARRKRTPGP